MPRFIFTESQLPQPLTPEDMLHRSASDVGLEIPNEICSTGVYIQYKNGHVSLFPPKMGLEAYNIPLSKLAQKYGWEWEKDRDFLMKAIDKSFYFFCHRRIKTNYARGDFTLFAAQENQWEFPFILKGISIWLRYHQPNDSLVCFISRLKERMADHIYLFNSDHFDVGLFCYVFMGEQVPVFPLDRKDFFCLIKDFPQFAKWNNKKIQKIEKQIDLYNQNVIGFEEMMNAIGGEEKYILKMESQNKETTTGIQPNNAISAAKLTI